MRAVFVLLALVIACSPICAAAADGASIDTAILADTDDASFDAAFQCPETLATPDDRESELQRYLAWAASRHPDWTFRKRLDVRYGLLRRHGCAATLARVAASARPAFAP